MRSLALLLSVCLVAAAGARPAAAAPGRTWATEVSRGVATVATLRARGIDAVPPGRTDSSQLSRAVVVAASQASRTPGPAGARAPAPDLPAVLAGAPVALAPRVPSAAAATAGRSLAVHLR